MPAGLSDTWYGQRIACFALKEALFTTSSYSFNSGRNFFQNVSRLRLKNWRKLDKSVWKNKRKNLKMFGDWRVWVWVGWICKEQLRAVIGMPYSCRGTVRLKMAVFHRFNNHAPALFRRIPESTTTFGSLIGGEIHCGCCTGPRSTGRTERICTANRFLVLSKVDSSSGNHLRAVDAPRGRDHDGVTDYRGTSETKLFVRSSERFTWQDESHPR